MMKNVPFLAMDACYKVMYFMDAHLTCHISGLLWSSLC